VTREAARSPGVARPPLFSRAFVLLWIAAFGFFTAGNTVLPVSSRFAAGPLGADSAGVGIAIGVFSVAALALRPVVGWASDRFGRRPLLILGGSLTVAALVLHLFVTTLPMFIVARAIFGVGDAFFFVSAVPYLSLDESRFGPYWPSRGWLLLHITTGMIALFTGPIQIWLGLSDRSARYSDSGDSV